MNGIPHAHHLLNLLLMVTPLIGIETAQLQHVVNAIWWRTSSPGIVADARITGAVNVERYYVARADGQ